MQNKNIQLDENKIIARPVVGVSVLILGTLVLLLSIVLAISVGAANIDFFTVWNSIFNYDPQGKADQIIMDIRLPREIGVMVVGAALAVSGAIMQGVTKNPLAESGLLGINAGAGFALACLLAFHSQSSYVLVMFISFIGASIGAGMVFGISALKRGGMSPLRIILAGSVVMALLTALADGIAVLFKITQDLSIWKIGSSSGTTWLQLKIAVPVVIVALFIAILLSKKLTILSFGDDIAKGLGERTALMKFVLMVIVLVLAGVSVSLVGALAFVGLMVPHMVRFFVGTDYRWVIPCSGVFGSVLLVLSDIAARMINAPFETPIGAIVAIIGVPFFLYLARREGSR
ncbi:FecCD family ABC transporter permease [Shimazuella kribbensis]|uniref:FecCD family ABC transporter permease n=1 Tax=Shimazuella kribbensis TaxID=139808 RepID=UPI0003FA59F2|nr:iron ABC transporter permease [Shimazuella kribbensis]